jgi:thioredoxin 1
MKIKLIIGFIIGAILFFYACQGKENENRAERLNSQQYKVVNSTQKESTNQLPLITFVELGSVNCIPCKKMQPVMKAIEEKYKGQVKVIFYDVWKADQKKYAREYDINLIPTQVFLDKDGKEIMRHEGYFPEAEIDAFLKEQGLAPKSES